MSDVFNSQADLWFFPPAKHSRWFSHFDWYLNWQMCKGSAHSGLHLPPETLTVAQEYNIPVPELSHGQTPLMVSCEGLLPPKHCIVVDHPNPLDTWLSQIQEISQRLGAKKLHIFLPRGASQESATTSWKKLDSRIDASFMSDKETP